MRRQKRTTSRQKDKMIEHNEDEKSHPTGTNKACVPGQVFKFGFAGCFCCFPVAAAEILKCVLLIRRPLALHGSFLKKCIPEQVHACEAM